MKTILDCVKKNLSRPVTKKQQKVAEPFQKVFYQIHMQEFYIVFRLYQYQ